MFKVIFYRQISHILFKGQMFSYIPFDRNLCIPLFTLQKLKNMNMGDVCCFNCHLVLASVPKPIFAHQVHIWKRWFYRILDLDGLGQWNLPHAFNCQINSPIIKVPNLWKPMKYLHMFMNRNNHNQQSH